MEFKELSSKTWNMSLENIFLGNVAFELTKSDAWLPSYTFFRKMWGSCGVGKEREPMILPVYGCGKRYS